VEDLLQGNSHKRTKESEETSTGYAKKVLEVLDGEKLSGEPFENSKFNSSRGSKFNVSVTNTFVMPAAFEGQSPFLCFNGFAV
jgi:hypothetical protein